MSLNIFLNISANNKDYLDEDNILIKNIFKDNYKLIIILYD
jgi:hypothetical protein